jgi:hypothetical protein
MGRAFGATGDRDHSCDTSTRAPIGIPKRSSELFNHEDHEDHEGILVKMKQCFVFSVFFVVDFMNGTTDELHGAVDTGTGSKAADATR